MFYYLEIDNFISRFLSSDLKIYAAEPKSYNNLASWRIWHSTPYMEG